MFFYFVRSRILIISLSKSANGIGQFYAAAGLPKFSPEMSGDFRYFELNAESFAWFSGPGDLLRRAFQGADIEIFGTMTQLRGESRWPVPFGDFLFLFHILTAFSSIASKSFRCAIMHSCRRGREHGSGTTEAQKWREELIDGWDVEAQEVYGSEDSRPSP